MRRVLLLTAVVATASVLVTPAGPGAASTATATATSGTTYLKPVTSITPAKGCHSLTAGINGVKVKLVQRRLGFRASYWETYDSATAAAVRRFQQRKGMRVSGVVGRPTWEAMGFTPGFCMDRYQPKVALPLSASRAQRVEQMIRYAKTYLGSEYVWGGAGRARYGVDCSGLALQALHSAGLDPQPITVDKHVLPTYRTSRRLFAHDGMRHVRFAHVRRGDLVFWKKRSTGRINHVAIYLGRGRVIEAVEPEVHFARTGDRSTQLMVRTVVRAFV